jgi:FkbM family methyltransferase
MRYPAVDVFLSPSDLQAGASSLYHRFHWTPASEQRNAILRIYEPLQPYVLVSLAEKLDCHVFIDVGANIGAYSLFLSTVPSIRTIHAFEPSPASFRQLNSNLELNRLGTRAKGHQQAVTAAPATLTFGVANALSGTNSVVSTSIHEAESFEQQIEVEGVKLDDVLSLRDERICMKIDVEGHERDALLGMRETLSRNTAVVQIEHYPDGRDYMDLFDELGFTKLFQLGPDLYLTNAELGGAELIGIFENASRLMIDDAKTANRQTARVNVHVGRELNIQLEGSLARSAQKARGAVRRIFKI